jgi:hypothetical protein
MNRPLYEIDRELLALHAKLHATENKVLQWRLIQKIDKLLDERNQSLK